MFGRGLGTGGCKRCSLCSMHYPPHSKFDECPVCGDKTSFFSNVEPDADWEDRLKSLQERPRERSVGADPEIHRFDGFLRLGFTLDEAQRLFLAKWGPWDLALWPGTVEKALQSGKCDHALALEIFA